MAVGTPEDFGLDEYGFFKQADPRMIGQSWVDHGYRPTPTFDSVEDCPVCGAPQTTCTNETHQAGMTLQRLARGAG